MDKDSTAHKLDRVEEVPDDTCDILWHIRQLFLDEWLQVVCRLWSQLESLAVLKTSLLFCEVGNADQAENADFEDFVSSILADEEVGAANEEVGAADEEVGTADTGVIVVINAVVDEITGNADTMPVDNEAEGTAGIKDVKALEGAVVVIREREGAVDEKGGTTEAALDAFEVFNIFDGRKGDALQSRLKLTLLFPLSPNSPSNG